MCFEVSCRVGQAEFAHVDPGEIGRLDRAGLDSRLAGQCRRNPVAVAGQVGDQFAMPVGAVAVGCFAGGEAEHIDVRHDALHGMQEAAAQPGIGDHRKGAAEAGDVVSFRRCHQRDAAFGRRRR